MTETEQRIAKIINDYAEKPQENLSNGASLAGDLGMDSLDQVEALMAIEDEFSVEIPDEEAEKFSTVQNVIDAVTARVGEKAAA